MISKSKLYAQLDGMEEELHERLVPHLQKAVAGDNDLVFCTTDFNPFAQLNSRTDAETDALVQLGRQILALMEKLDEPSTGSIAERICWYCRQWGDTGDSHRSAAKGLALEFLQEIEKASTER